MVGAAVFAYGMLATFVHASAARNRKLGQNHSPTLEAAGWTLLSGSAVGGLLAIGYGAWMTLSPAF